MATQTMSNNGGSITCSSCQMTVVQSPGTRRTICPHCGNFYDPAHAASVSQRRHDRPKPEDDPRYPQKDDRSGGRLQAISNFFHNLGPNKKSKNGESSSNSPDNQQTNSGHSSQCTSPSSSATIKKTRQSEVRSPSLPPIAQESKGRLTAGSSELSLRESSARQGGRSQRRPGSGRPGSAGRTRSGRPSSGRSRTRTNSANNIIIHLEDYKYRDKKLSDLTEDLLKAKVTKDWRDISEYFSVTFNSFTEINAAFRVDITREISSSEDPGVKLDFLNNVYDILLETPIEIQKGVLKSVINSLLKDKRPHTKDDLRAYLILLQSPQFSNITTYVIFAHLLRQIAALQDQDHHYLVHWFKRVDAKRFKHLVSKLHSFISCRLFPPKPQDLPPMSKCTWWIPSATKVLALLNATNNLCNPPLISFLEFYNSTLDHLDLMAEYYTWQNPSAHPGFSFCQYPFIFSIAAKRTILQRDSEQQMIIMARRSLVAKVQRRQLPDIGMLFLNLTVRRSNLVADSLNEIARKQHDLKKKLKVTFAGEPGLDMGGLTKEWFLLLIRQIFQPDYGMFTYDKKARVYWFSTAQCDNYQEFNLVGVLMGLAVYNSIILDIRFPPCCYKKLLSPAVVPYSNPRATVGVASLTLQDLTQTMPDVAHGLQELLDYEENVEDDFCLTFQITYNELGHPKTQDLKPNGSSIPVTNKNRKEYVSAYIEFMLNKSVYQQFQAFYHGFHSVCASNALIMLRPEEVEMLVCGNPTLNMAELKKVTVYDGYSSRDPTIKMFWEVVLGLPQDLQKKVLFFTTGSDRIPIGGMSEMQFKITKVDNIDMLPMAHTCFNQLVLPAYKNKKVLKQKMIIAVKNAEGFGIE